MTTRFQVIVQCLEADLSHNNKQSALGFVIARVVDAEDAQGAERAALLQVIQLWNEQYPAKPLEPGRMQVAEINELPVDDASVSTGFIYFDSEKGSTR